ncbi:MAG: hypothetical protein AAFO63_03050 [Pseudomonadota bacterium]
MTGEGRAPDATRLWLIVAGAAMVGVFTSLIFWLQIAAGGGMGWVGYLIIAMLGLTSYSISFYFGHRFFEDSLDRYIVSDTFGRKHGYLDLETETIETGDAVVDGWVAHYKFIRIIFAMGLLPLIACVYLFFFA